MNPACPECQTQLNEDFGIVTCTSCGAVCSVDLDGEAVVKGQDDSVVKKDFNLQEDETSDLEGFGEDSLDKTNIEEGFSLESLEDPETEEELSLEEPEDFEEESILDEPDAFEEEAVEEDTSDSFEAVEEPESFEVEEESSDNEEQSAETTKTLSSSGFFKGLEVFTKQLEPQDFHHTYYQVEVSGFVTKDDFSNVMDLTLDDRLGVTEESLKFSDSKQSFIIEKLSFLRLVMLHKRLSTLSFLKIEWVLSEDQSDFVESEFSEDDESTAIGEPMEQEEVQSDDDLYEEVEEESDF